MFGSYSCKDYLFQYSGFSNVYSHSHFHAAIWIQFQDMSWYSVPFTLINDSFMAFTKQRTELHLRGADVVLLCPIPTLSHWGSSTWLDRRSSCEVPCAVACSKLHVPWGRIPRALRFRAQIFSRFLFVDRTMDRSSIRSRVEVTPRGRVALKYLRVFFIQACYCFMLSYCVPPEMLRFSGKSGNPFSVRRTQGYAAAIPPVSGIFVVHLLTLLIAIVYQGDPMPLDFVYCLSYVVGLWPSQYWARF